MPPTGQAASLVELANPSVDFCSLAAGLGVSSRRVETGPDLAAAIGSAMAEPGPHLIEAIIED